LKQVTVEAPASSANMGPGFDVFALALDRPRDRITLRVEKKKSAGLSMTIENMSDGAIPLEPRKNGAGVAALAVAADHGINGELRMNIWKGVPIGLGMGSSAASAAAAVVAVSEIFDLRLSTDAMVYYAAKGEAVTSGAAHYDNVAAAIAGGFVIVRAGKERPSTVTLAAPKNLSLVLVTPEVDLPAKKTAYARSLLPETTSLRKMVGNVASASIMVAGFALKDTGMIGAGMTDPVVEDARKVMIPGYDLVKSEALAAGAKGVCISGAGPTMLAALDSKTTDPETVLAVMVGAFRKSGVQAKGLITRAGKGARVVVGDS
jgi:homoserine kinase